METLQRPLISMQSTEQRTVEPAWNLSTIASWCYTVSIAVWKPGALLLGVIEITAQRRLGRVTFLAAPRTLRLEFDVPVRISRILCRAIGQSVSAHPVVLELSYPSDLSHTEASLRTHTRCSGELFANSAQAPPLRSKIPPGSRLVHPPNVLRTSVYQGYP